MKTNEAVKRQLLSQAEEAIEVLLEQMEEVKAGDLQRLEQCILENMMELGRRSMETILASEAREEPVAVPQEGRCGQGLKWAGDREKTVLTLMGPIVIKRAYSHCKEEKPAEGVLQRRCPGTIPFDEQWGLTRRQASPGVAVDACGPKHSVARQATAEEFAPLASALARQMGLLRAQPVVILGDGARWIWKLADEPFPGAVQIVAEYHAREHVWKVARAAFAAEPELRDAWATQVIESLGNGRVHEIIAAIERLPTLSPEPGKTKSVQDIEAEYFRHTAHRMQYPVFRAQGMHLGSGIAEATSLIGVGEPLLKWSRDLQFFPTPRICAYVSV